MKMRYTFEVNDLDRRAISHAFGKSGKATRSDCLAFLTYEGEGTLERIVSDYEAWLQIQEQLRGEDQG
jgi:hypothetical protein